MDARSTSWAALLAVALVGGACNLEAALGVDGDGSSTSAMTEGGPGGSMGPGGPGSGVDGTTGASSGLTNAATGEGPADSSGPGPEPTECAGRSLRIATFNVQSVGGMGSNQHQALADVITRIDADVICLEEVLFYETADLFALAEATGYPRVIQGNEPPAIGGDFTNACLGRDDLSLVGSYSGWDLSPDQEANDVGREILVVRVDLSEPGLAPCRLGVVALHLKSGQDSLDWFRRQVEAERVVQAVEQYRAAYPGDPMVIMGDLNETIDDPALGSVFREVPVGLPPSYQVGSDIEFPLTYQPFDTFTGLGFTVTDAYQEDSPSADETWNDVVRLDYVLHAGAVVEGSEVYNACRDDGVDDPPEGNWLPKAGPPLDCAVSEDASDHFPVLVDLTLP